ncbi:MAG: hypothetical protein WC928_01750 [Patescibacteria group bacterium]|jgi:hypothetical protein
MIKIRIHKKIDIPYRLRWLNNPKVNRYIGDKLGEKTTLKEQEKWFKNYQKDKNKKFFTIFFDNKPVGWSAYQIFLNRIERLICLL